MLSGLLDVHAQMYQSQLSLTTFGYAVQQQSTPDLLATISNVMSVILCAGYCNQQQLCRVFDYHMATGICRIFSNGGVVSSNLSRSRVGTIRDLPSLYSSYSHQCTLSNCQVNRNLICGTNYTCQCPTGLVWNTQMCVSE